MMIRITELEGGEAHSPKTLLIEGSLNIGGAQLLANLCERAAQQTEQVIIDLSGVSYLDEASAAVLRRLCRYPNFTLTGASLFTRALLEEVEAAGD